MAFEDFSEYISNFDMLNKMIPDEKKQKEYVDSWKGKYKKQILENKPQDID